MLDDERLKTLELVRDARKEVSKALASKRPAAEKKPLEELQICLEKAEGDLFITALEKGIYELRDCRQRLADASASLSKDAGDLKAVAHKIERTAKAIGVVIDIAEKVVVPPPEVKREGYH